MKYRRDIPKQSRFSPNLGKVVYALLIGGPVLNVHSLLDALPSFIQLALIALLGIGLLRILIRFKRWNDEMIHLNKFVRATLTLVAVVLLENFCTWATSASDARKYDYEPLQDNVELATLWVFSKSPLLRTIIMGWRVDMHWLLYSFVCLCISVAWDAVPYSGFGIGARFMDTIAWSHLIRTFAFMITILPNPRPGCYKANFPPVPSSIWEFIKIGFGAKRGSGCNDLVISGHGVVYAVVPLALQTFYRHHGATAIAWAAVIKLCIQETVDKTHYSVDMFLAVVIAGLVWHWRQDVYSASATWKTRQSQSADPVPKGLVALVIGILIVVFIGVKGV